LNHSLEEQVNLEVPIPAGAGGDSKKLSYARRLTDLNGKTIGEISNRLWAADSIFPLIRESLRQRYPDIKFVPYPEFPSGSNEITSNEELGELALSKGCDAVIGATAG
jgi:hypothetical protein